MRYVITPGMTAEEIEKIKKKLWKGKEVGFNARKLNGVLKIKGDALTIQKKLRDEWERNIG